MEFRDGYANFEAGNANIYSNQSIRGNESI